MSIAIAHTNIALIKYWGKRDEQLNLPATGSLSLTLGAFSTTTEVVPAAKDSFILDGCAATPAESARVFAFIDQLRQSFGQGQPVLVKSQNDVPKAAGLASSASAFCALTLAAADALGQKLDERTLSAWSRRGSGSAARSVFGGFVCLDKGEREDGLDCVARPLTTNLDVRMVVVRTSTGEKKVKSTEGMNRTRDTSPFYAPWVQSHAADLICAQDALAKDDLQRLGEVMERSTLKMHASGLGATPPLWYWNARTWAVIEIVRQLCQQGTPAWFTMDAGPHVKILTDAQHADVVARAVGDLDGIADVLISGPGVGAHLL